MTRAWLADAIENNYDGHRGHAQYLPFCWISRGYFERWLVKHRLPQEPQRFEPDRAATGWIDPDYDEHPGEVIHPSGQAPEGGPRKGSPALERAQQAISQIYPDGVPSQAMLPNAILCRRVGAWLKEKKLPDVSDATILRAAGRRK
jgi:hypothetical protein